MSFRRCRFALILGALCWLAACQPVPIVVETVVATPTLSPAPTAIPTSAAASVPPRDDPTPAEPLPETIGQPPATPSGERPTQAARAARRIAARFLKVEQSAVAVHGVKAVVWPDSGLGCGPVGGRRPVSTPGYLAMVEVAGQVYEVHMTESGRGIICLESGPK